MNSVQETEANYEKCGEILASPKAGLKDFFQLRCVFCESVFLIQNYLEFTEHINKDHLNHSIKEEELECKIENNFYVTDDNFQDTAASIEHEHKNEFTDETDVLREPTIKIESTGDNINNDLHVRDELSNELVDDTSIRESLENLTDEVSETESDCSDSLVPDINKEREVTLALIAAYKELPLLWNVEHSHFAVKWRRKSAFTKLANSLTFQFGKPFKEADIEKRIKYVRKCYLKDLLQQRQSTKGKDENSEACWFFEKLDFLKHIIELEQNNAKLSEKEENNAFRGKFNAERKMQLIEIYERFPCLWNHQHVEYRLKTKRKTALKEILRIVEENMQIKILEHQLHKRLYRIRFMCTKEKMQELKCQRQGIDYKPKCKFYSKIKFLHDYVAPFKCSKCAKTFKSVDQYQKHVSSHDGVKPFSCSICQRGFDEFANLKVHMERHNNDFKYNCNDCGKGFLTLNESKEHSRIHTGEKPFCCDTCGKSFAHKSAFSQHVRTHKKCYSFICEVCNRGFYQGSQLKEHMNIHWNIRDKICSDCGKAFTTNAYLRKHRETHKEKKYVCKICSKNFAQYAGLFTHMKKH